MNSHLFLKAEVGASESQNSRDKLSLMIYPEIEGDGWWILISKGDKRFSQYNFATAADAAKAAADCIEEFSANPAAFVLAHPQE